ncbi:MAG: hypothetical protein MJ238_04175, partial [Bacilli bacterium]|nr:hypothetical protein [Bacilli bacterium]
MKRVLTTVASLITMGISIPLMENMSFPFAVVFGIALLIIGLGSIVVACHYSKLLQMVFLFLNIPVDIAMAVFVVMELFPSTKIVSGVLMCIFLIPMCFITPASLFLIDN